MNRKQEKAAKKTFCLPQKMKDWLSRLSKETQISEAEHLRRAIDAYRKETAMEIKKLEGKS